MGSRAKKLWSVGWHLATVFLFSGFIGDKRAVLARHKAIEAAERAGAPRPARGAAAAPAEFTKRPDFLPFARPTIGDEEVAEVVASLESGWVTTGPKVKQFEEAVAGYVGAGHAVAVSSCTAGLHLSLQALGVGRGDEVIVPTLTFCSTANVVEHLGARPVLVDVDTDFAVTVDGIRDALTERTKALMPVHFAGQPVDLPEIYALAHDHGIAVVEDAAHAIGGSYEGSKVGSDELAADFPDLRRAVVFSFYVTKNITTGEGGMVVTNDAETAASIRSLSLHGMTRDAWDRYSSTGSWYYEVVAPGYKANMTDLQAALGLRQLERLDAFLEARRHQARLYDEELADIPEVARPLRRPGRDHVFHLYVLRLQAEQLTIDRAAFLDQLRQLNVGGSVHFIPVHMHPYYKEKYEYRALDFPSAERLYHQIVSLPIYPRMSDLDVRYVAAAVRHTIASSKPGQGLEQLNGGTN